MANKDDYLTYYREFFENFAQTVNPNDQLPVKLASYKLINLEVVGGVIDWTTQYLTQKKCPQSLIAPLIQIVIDETRKACKKHPTSCGFNPSDNAYEPLKLMQTVMAKTNEICLRYLDNSMLCSLPAPGYPHNIVSVSAAKNRRRRMEDRHVVVHDLNTMFNIQEASPSSYYAIFDGHAGHDAAAYSSAHLHQFLAESKHFATNPEQALLDAFCKTDALFINKCNVERFNSGTTAVCALLRPKEKTLYIAWVGDSQALLVNQGRVLQCVNPHKPCRTDERERIEKEGGYVCYWGTWRVNGQLAVSRAIGDAEYKPYVIAVPDIREIPLDGGEDFLILACDGLWDFLSEDDAARTVYEMVCSNPDETDPISERLVYLSKEKGSADNISVIVVFLREPSKIAAEAHWANRNAMDTSLDNANNPFANSNGADNAIIGQKSEGLLLNLSDNFKRNGSDLSPAGDFFHNSEKSNGKRLASEFDDEDDLGPETDVDAVDDVLSPSIAAAKALAEGIVNNNPDGSFNPFVEKHEVEKAALEMDLDLQKQQSSEFDGERSPREETPTPPADAVHDGGLEENIGDSGEESEDEWNYIKGEEANKENIGPSQADIEVADLLEEQENMSQLNPNAAEFVPVSPTRSIPSPACRLMNDPVIAQSPKRPSEIDISLPNPQDFEKEVKSRPSDFDTFSNGHDHEGDQKSSTQELMENLLNGKNIDEIPEFQPGSTPSKVVADEFHFGPNAAPFTPAKLLDQSEAALSTKAVFGDESVMILDSTLDASRDNVDFSIKHKDEDPMSMSFYQEKDSGDADPFDLNKVQLLPENLEDFLSKPDVAASHEDVQEHAPVGDVVSDEIILNNDERIQTTDLDKVDDEKELASPVSNDDESSGVCELSKSPQPQVDDLMCQLECSLPRETLPDVCLRPESKSPQLSEELKLHSPEPELLSPDPGVEALSPEPVTESPVPQALSPEPTAVSPVPQTLSPEPDAPVALSPEPVASPEPSAPALSPEPQELALSPEPQKAALSPEPREAAFSPVPQEPVLSPARSPTPQEVAFSPEPEGPIVSLDTQAPVLSPEPQEPVLSPEPHEPVSSPEPQAPVLSPEPQAPVLSPEPQQPVLSPEPKEPVLTPEPEPLISQSLSPDPFEDVCKISKSPLLEAAAPEPSEDVCSLTKTIEFEKVKTPEPEPEQPIEVVKEPVTEIISFEIEERKELVESPLEDITSSVKDVSSPIVSPVPDQVAPESDIQLSFAQEINNAVLSQVTVETSSPIREDEPGPDVCPIRTPQSVTDTESVATADVNSFLERSQIVDLTSPLSQSETTITTEHPLSKCVYPLPTEIETENITPEFAEPVVISPTETKDDTPSVPSLQEETVKEPEVAAESAPVAAAVAGVAAAAAVGTAAAVAATAEKKPAKAKASIGAKKPAAGSAKPPSPTKPAPSPAKARVTPTAKAKPLAAARTTPTAAKTTTAPKPPVPKAAPKAKTPTTARTSLEKKPLANGDVKAPIRSTLIARRSAESAKPPPPKPAVTVTKASPARPATSRPSTAGSKPAAPKPATTTTLKPRPTTLASKTATSTTAASKTVSSTTTTKLTATKTAAAPRVSSPSKPRPATAPAKPRVPATKTVTKTSADTEKQHKDSANKLTASRTLASTRTTATASSRTTTSTLKKTESKVSGATRTTVTKTTSTTTRPGAGGKKPQEIIRNGNKTKTTKIEKPVQNGVTTVVTEQITIVNNAVVSDSDSLMKDNSPIDNKLLVDTNAAD